VEDGSLQEIPLYNIGAYRLAKIEQHKRIYEKAFLRLAETNACPFGCEHDELPSAQGML
jgi:hypothetical protein